jgi:hypothetical protein
MFDVTVDTSAVPTTVILDVYYATGSPSSTPIATPDILTGRAPATTTAMVWSVLATGSAGVHTTTIGLGLRSSTGFDHPMYIGVIALSNTGVAAGAWSGPIDQPENSTLQLSLDPTLVPEAWGHLSDSASCFRLQAGTTTVFITRTDDPDCDGLTGAQDMQPYAFCDPTATSGPAYDACL